MFPSTRGLVFRFRLAAHMGAFPYMLFAVSKLKTVSIIYLAKSDTSLSPINLF